MSQYQAVPPENSISLIISYTIVILIFLYFLIFSRRPRHEALEEI